MDDDDDGDDDDDDSYIKMIVALQGWESAAGDD